MGADYAAAIHGKDANYDVDQLHAGADITGDGIDFQLAAANGSVSELRGYESGAFEPDGEFRTLTDQKNLTVEDIMIQLRNVTALEPFRPFHDQHE